MTFYTGSIIGFLLDLAFGVGCALAVMYTLFLGGYRAALRDFMLPTEPKRLRHARIRLIRSGHAQER